VRFDRSVMVNHADIHRHHLKPLENSSRTVPFRMERGMPYRQTMKGKMQIQTERFKTSERSSTQNLPSPPVVFPFNKTFSTTNEIFLARHETFATSPKVLSVAGKVLCAADETLFAADKTVAAIDKPLSPADKIVSAADKTLFTGDRVLVAGNKVFLIGDIVFFNH